MEPAAGPDQTSGAVGTMATSDPPGAPLPPGEEVQSSPGWKGVASKEAENWADVPRMRPGAGRGGPGPGKCGNWPRKPQPHRGEGGPTAQEGRAAAPPRVVAMPGRGKENTDEGGPPSARGIPPLPPGVMPPPPRGATNYSSFRCLHCLKKRCNHF